MIKTLLRNKRKILLLLILLFAVMFGFRLMYGYYKTDTELGNDLFGDYFSSTQIHSYNYATEKKGSVKTETTQAQMEAPAELSMQQKYEKTATAKSQSSDFTKDEQHTRELIKNSSSVVQYEKMFGADQQRQMHLMIGVIPEKFDSVYKEIILIGKVSNPEVIKVDKTNEYRQLNARKISLQKSLASLVELKQKGGQIEEYISLNEKIMETEQQLQDLGVDLGNFNSANEFCTIRFSLYETGAPARISFIHRIKVSLEWTIRFYFLLTFALACAAIASWGIAKATELTLGIIEKNKSK